MNANNFDRKFAFNHHRSSGRWQVYLFSVAIGLVFISIQLFATRYKPTSGSDTTLPASNRFSHSAIGSPYEQIFVVMRLPTYHKKKSPEAQQIEKTISPTERICFVHVGKSGGSTVGCALGFGLHCKNNTKMVDGLLPRRTTNMFHADCYDCYDESKYFLFVVRNPLERIKSAFLYERPYGVNWLKNNFPQYYQNRKSFYMDCPFRFMEDWVQIGLLGKTGSRGEEYRVSEKCEKIARHAVWGTGHYQEHLYFNYQFHLEGLPGNANVLTIRNEHLVDDWNQVEQYIGGERDIITPENAQTAFPVINKKNMTKDPSVRIDPYSSPKYLSEESVHTLCRHLCNEIVNYKKILRRSVNLNYLQIEESITELRESCGKYADYEEGDCHYEMPDIEGKLLTFRGYVDKVRVDAVDGHRQRLEGPLPRPKWPVEGTEDEQEEKDLVMDDDAPLPYSL
mmetsp:Transcript_17639/g.27650  ORF Transcript_17639/g.27650 Transcript_17639/m.27650 type:complete len:452 (-) Transcript_17639:97-1452(-)